MKLRYYLLLTIIFASIAWQGSLIPPERQQVVARHRTVTLNGSRRVDLATPTRLADGEIVEISGQAETFKYVNGVPQTFDLGINIEVRQDGAAVGRLERQFSSPINPVWYGAVGDYNFGTNTGTDNATALTQAFAYAGATARSIFLPGDYFTTVDPTTTGIKRIIGPGSVRGTSTPITETWRDRNGNTTLNLDGTTGVQKFPKGITTSSNISPITRSWMLVDSVTERPNADTEATELRIDLPVFTATTTNQATFVRFSATWGRGSASNSNDGLVFIDTLACVSTRYAGGNFHALKFETLFKTRSGASSDNEDLDLSATLSGDQLVLRIQPIISGTVNAIINAKVDVYSNTIATAESLAAASWQLVTGQAVLPESSNQCLKPKIVSDVLYISGEEIGNTSLSGGNGIPLGVYAVADPAWSVAENTTYLQRKIDAARTAKVKLVSVGKHRFDSTLSLGNWPGMVIEGFGSSETLQAANAWIWQGGVTPTTPMLTYGGRHGSISNMSFFGRNNGQTSEQHSPETCWSWVDTTAVCEGHLYFQKCIFGYADHLFTSGITAENSCKSDLVFDFCTFISPNLGTNGSGYRSLTSQNMHHHLYSCRWESCGDTPCIRWQGGGMYQIQGALTANCNEFIRVTGSGGAGGQMGLNNFAADIVNFKSDGNTDRFPTLFNMVGTGAHSYDGHIRWNGIKVSSGVGGPPSTPVFVIQGSTEMEVNDFQPNTNTSTYTLARLEYGGSNTARLNPRFSLTNSRIDGWDGTVNNSATGNDIVITFQDDGGTVQSFPYWDIRSCSANGLQFADIGNTPSVVYHANSEKVVTVNTTTIDVTNVSHLRIAFPVVNETPVTTFTGGKPGQVLFVTLEDTGRLGNGTTQDAIYLDGGGEVTAGTGGYHGIFRFNGTFWAQFAASQK